MNIHNPSAIRDCTSCQVCAAVCPKDAITIVLDEKGFYRPVIDDKCVDCSLCTKVCYKYNDIEISDKTLSDRKSTRLNSSHGSSRMPSSA